MQNMMPRRDLREVEIRETYRIASGYANVSSGACCIESCFGFGQRALPRFELVRPAEESAKRSREQSPRWPSE